MEQPERDTVEVPSSLHEALVFWQQAQEAADAIEAGRGGAKKAERRLAFATEILLDEMKTGGSTGRERAGQEGQQKPAPTPPHRRR